VSTDKQGQSGLGLDAQRQAVMTYHESYKVLEPYLCSLRARRYAPASNRAAMTSVRFRKNNRLIEVALILAGKGN